MVSELPTNTSNINSGNNNSISGNANVMSLTNVSSVSHNQDNSNASAGSHQSDEHILASPQQDHVSTLYEVNEQKSGTNIPQIEWSCTVYVVYQSLSTCTSLASCMCRYQLFILL